MPVSKGQPLVVAAVLLLCFATNAVAASPHSKDKVRPSVTLISPTAGSTVSGTISLAATASDKRGVVASVTFRVDGSSVGTDTTSLTSPYSVSFDTTTVADGSHTFSAQATDTSGNQSTVSEVSATVRNGADTTPPDTTITAGPSGTVSSSDASFSFTSSDSGSSFECQLDGGPWGSCTSPKSYSGLADGSHTFEVRATDTSGNIDQSPASRTWTIDATAGSDPVATVAGDIADDGPGDTGTAAVVQSIKPDLVFTAGDNAYPDGTLTDFRTWYDPTWGAFKAETRPAPGNHDYQTSGAAGYFDYFNGVGVNDGPAGPRGQGYYSYDVGSWHLIALNNYVSMSAGSAQEQWLKNDLAQHPGQCTLAYWHEPRFTSGAEHSNNTATGPLWNDLYAAHADVVVNGHNHQYERFAQQNPSGAADPNGIREFVVGTGGAGLYAFGTIQPNSQVRNSTDHGVLKLTLHPSSYNWSFQSSDGSFTDSGTTSC